ncbi:MAG: 3-hydroxyacyl-CoA dehydrogenase [bacterium]|nr:3-hydroxyacyl-CoA dehydrogenase [bacterium]
MTTPISAGSPVAVVGAGTMGAGIAQVAAAAGHPVVLFDAVEGAADKALADLRTRMEKSVERGRRTEEEAQRIIGLVVGCGWLAECASASLVIEAIIEDLHTKRKVFAEIEELADPGAILATNTSSLSVTAIAAELKRPERFVGMHFFNPAPAMPLVEIVSGARTDAEVADVAAATVEVWGKEPVRCLSTPGFIVNRVARPFYGESLRLAADRIADYATIDALFVGSGRFRMGPFALMDLVGLDVNLAVSKSVFAQTFHDARFAPHVLQQSLVDAGNLGRKTGEGFFEYGKSATKAVPQTVAQQVAPADVEAHGDLGWAAGLTSRLLASGVEVDSVPAGGPGHFIFDGVHLVPTDGRTATELAAAEVFGSPNVVVFDLVHDWHNVARVGIARADQADPSVVERVAGLFQAIGCQVSQIDDAHGMVVMRTVAQLAAVAADTVAAGIATASDVDTAMRLGTNYPSGPLEWADLIGIEVIAAVLRNVRHGYGEDRYRVPALISRRAATNQPIRKEIADV